MRGRTAWGWMPSACRTGRCTDRPMRKHEFMPIVVLLGFSCAGKTTVLEAAKERWPDLQTLDTDREIAGGGDDDHIYDLFIESGRAAVHKIGRRENRLLASISPTDVPLLIAAGPALPSRSEWVPFVARCHPVCVHFEMTPEDVLEGLQRRRERHEAIGCGNRPNFGSWDEDVTTRSTPDGAWVLVDRATALANVERHMDGLIPRYEAASRFRWPIAERHGPNGRPAESLMLQLSELLGLDDS